MSGFEQVGIDLAIDQGSEAAAEWVRLLGDGASEHLLGKIIRIGFVPDATTGGRPAALLLVELPDGRRLQAAMTLRLFEAAAAAARGRYGTS